MIKNFYSILKSIFTTLKMTSNYLKRQFPYELKNTYACKETGKHLLEIKISGKSQSISYLAEEIAIDDDFITRFSPTDIRTISYLAACDKYETILQEEKIKKSYEIARSKNINGNKTILLKHKITDESIIVLLKNFANSDLIEKLDAQDVYQVGYLAGQEQFLKDNVRKNMTLIKNTEYQHDNVS